jgi:hypothetical protein
MGRTTKHPIVRRIKDIPVSFQPQSSNGKLSHVHKERHSNGLFSTHPQAPYVCSTYASITATCPTDCTFRDNGCYAQQGQAAYTTRRLDKKATELNVSGSLVNKMEADLIDAQWQRGVPQDGMRGGRDMRLHVSGDTADDVGAAYLSWAIDRFRGRGGGDAWGYTHNWRYINPDNLWSMSMLASVETLEDAEDAIDVGYTPAITVLKFHQRKAYSVPGSSLKIVPCPAQTYGRKCNECRLCFRDLPKGTMIGFELHGSGASAASKRLSVLGQEAMAF